MNPAWATCSEKVALRFSKTVLDSFFSFLPLRYEYREFDARRENFKPMRIGYARVSTRDQNLELQLDALNKAGCKRIFTDKLSGAQVERPGLKEALSHLREADTLVVWKLDRLGRSVKGLVDLVTNWKPGRCISKASPTASIPKRPPGASSFT
jgi:predicted site-specific integrase-resolvase